jgi:hypothetical protein
MTVVGAVTLAILGASGCGGRGTAEEDAGTGLDAAMDALAEGDATQAEPDGSTALDAAPDAQAEGDATQAEPDGSTASDASPDAPGGGACGSIGQACINATEDCAPDQRCDGTGAGPVCIPDRAGCGGFLPDECPTEAPVCIYCPGCDFGACSTDQEAACLCGTAEGADAFDCP